MLWQSGETNFHKAEENLAKHALTNAHLAAKSCLMDYRSISGGSTVADHLSQHYRDHLYDIEKKKHNLCIALKPVIDVVMLLAKQNIAFRRHDERESSFNRGNILQIVHLIAKYYEPLETHLEKWQKIAQYTSSMSQNAFIGMIAKHLQQRFVLPN